MSTYKHQYGESNTLNKNKNIESYKKDATPKTQTSSPDRDVTRKSPVAPSVGNGADRIKESPDSRGKPGRVGTQDPRQPKSNHKTRHSTTIEETDKKDLLIEVDYEDYEVYSSEEKSGENVTGNPEPALRKNKKADDGVAAGVKKVNAPPQPLKDNKAAGNGLPPAGRNGPDDPSVRSG